MSRQLGQGGAASLLGVKGPPGLFFRSSLSSCHVMLFYVRLDGTKAHNNIHVCRQLGDFSISDYCVSPCFFLFDIQGGLSAIVRMTNGGTSAHVHMLEGCIHSLLPLVKQRQKVVLSRHSLSIGSSQNGVERLARCEARGLYWASSPTPWAFYPML